MILLFNDAVLAAPFAKGVLRLPLSKRHDRLNVILREGPKDAEPPHFPEHPPIIYGYMGIAITDYCPRNPRCKGCFKRHRLSVDKRKSISLSSKDIDITLKYLKEKGFSKITLTGGEPIAEIEKVLRFVREAEVDTIVIFTSGYFAVNNRKTEEILNAISQALAGRKQLGRKPVEVFIRVSVDQLHSGVPRENIVRIIELFDKHHKSKYKDMGLFLKGILTDEDPIPSLITSLEGTITPQITDTTFLFEEVKLKSGFTFLVEYTELKLSKEALDQGIEIVGFERIYPHRIEKKDRIIIGAAINQDGLSISLEQDGTIILHDYLSDFFHLANIRQENFDEKVEEQLVSDPLILVMRNIGLNPIVDILNDIGSDIPKIALEANNQFLVISLLMLKPKLKERVYKRLHKLVKENNWWRTSDPAYSIKRQDGLQIYTYCRDRL